MDGIKYKTPPSNIIRNKAWLIAELDMADALYDKLMETPEDADLTHDMIPSPCEFLEEAESYIELWDKHHERLLEEFEETWALALEAERKEKSRKLEKYTLPPDEYLANRVAELDSGETPYIIPEEFHEARKRLDAYFKCTFSSYISLLVGLYKIMLAEFPEELQALTHTESI